MNTDIIRFDEPYCIIMDGGILYEQIGTLIASEKTENDEYDVDIVSSSYPIVDNGQVLASKLEDCVCITKNDRVVDLYKLPIMEYLRADADGLSFLFDQLKWHGIKIELPNMSEFNVYLYIREDEKGLFVQSEHAERTLFVESSGLKEKESFDFIYEQLCDYRSLFDRPIKIRCYVKKGKYKKYEDILNDKLIESENKL